jgi:hypothetical protein
MRYYPGPDRGPLSHPLEIAYFRDPFGTLFAAEIAFVDRWHPALDLPPDVSTADVRVVLMPDLVRPLIVPPWTVAGAGDLLDDPARLAGLAARAWVYSPHHREPGAEPGAYVAAGFGALCPPHPPCPVGPHSRASLSTFARHRDWPLGRLADEGRDGFDRWLRVCWRTPEDFAREILLQRIADAGSRDAAALIRFVDLAEVAPEAPGHTALFHERAALLDGLDPERFFLDRDTFEAARRYGEAWRERYLEEYRAHYRRVRRLGDEVMEDLAPALSAAAILSDVSLSARMRSTGCATRSPRSRRCRWRRKRARRARAASCWGASRQPSQRRDSPRPPSSPRWTSTAAARPSEATRASPAAGAPSTRLADLPRSPRCLTWNCCRPASIRRGA